MEDNDLEEGGRPVVDQFEDEFDLVLREAIVLGTASYETLHLTEPTAGQLMKASKHVNDVESLIALISLNAKVPMAVIEKMKQRDMERAGAFFAHFGTEKTG